VGTYEIDDLLPLLLGDIRDGQSLNDHVGLNDLFSEKIAHKVQIFFSVRHKLGDAQIVTF
jgi:hypothetical protein